MAGLIAVHRTARRSGDVLEAALVESAGIGLPQPHRRAVHTPARGGADRRQLVAPEMRLRRRYRSARDVSYGEFGLRNQLDVWKRSDLPADARAPVLVQIHGGAWTMGKKEGQAEPLMAHLAERGWVCVTANYRLSPRATWPDHIVDVKRALAWTKANIAGYGGDPSFIVITGGSAGGHLSALAALTPALAEFQPGFEDVDTSVAAAVPFYGVYDFTDRHGADNAELVKFLAKRVFKSPFEQDRARWEQASPISHVGPHAAAVLRPPRHQRLARAHRTAPDIRRRTAQELPAAGRLRRGSRCATTVRDDAVGANPCHRRTPWNGSWPLYAADPAARPRPQPSR